jgi:hypothetical protein
MTRMDQEYARARQLVEVYEKIDAATDAVNVHSGQEYPARYLRRAAAMLRTAAENLEQLATHFDLERYK